MLYRGAHWPRLARRGDSRPAATQAAPPSETTGKPGPVTAPCPLHTRPSPSIHRHINNLVLRHRFSLRPSLFSLPGCATSIFTPLSFLLLSNFCNLLFLLISSFIERLEGRLEDVRRLQLKAPCLIRFSRWTHGVY